jgi:RNA polymerase sigma-70 factor (ECF subfamily)
MEGPNMETVLTRAGTPQHDPKSETRLRASTPPSDSELVVRTRSGDRGAYNELVRRHQRMARGIALRLLRNEDDAAEVVQEALLGVFVALQSDEILLFAAFLRVAVRNCSLNRRKHLSRRGAHVEFEEAHHEASVATQDLRVECLDLLRIVDELSETERRPLALLADGRSYDEVAEFLGIPAGTVKSTVHRARKAVARRVGRSGRSSAA